MLKNYVTVALRNARKHWLFTIINMTGLTLGMSCCFLIVIYVWHEYHYDQFLKNRDRLYRVQYHIMLNEELEFARIPPPIGPLLTDYFPEIEASARFFLRSVSVSVPEREVQVEMDDIYFADSTAHQLFQFDFLYGNGSTALKEPFSVVLTEETANRLFGKTDVLGERLQLADRDDFVVTGVIANWPEQSHIGFNMLVPYDNMFDLEPPESRQAIKDNLEKNWIASHSYTYVLLKENQLAGRVNDKFPGFLEKHGAEQFKDKQGFDLIPVTEIHLATDSNIEPRPTANVDYLYLFMGIGGITLLIACFNFVNLSTATSVERAKEVGLRKVLGARKLYLAGQFLGESLMYSFVAFVISMLLVVDFLPILNQLLGTNIEFVWSQHKVVILLFLVIFILAGLLAGGYPAILASRFKTLDTLKSSKGNSVRAGGLLLRKSLITVQFLAAVFFIGCAVSVFQQLHYLRNQPMGFNKEMVLSIPINSHNMNTVFRGGDPQIRQRMDGLDDILTRHANIKSVTQCYQLPGFGAVRRKVWTDDMTREENIFVDVLAVDYDYAETFGLQTIAGRDFDISYGTDHLEGFLINESAVKTFGWENPEKAIGEKLVLEQKEGKVVGVIKDYNFQDLRAIIQPLIMEVRPSAFNYFAVRVSNHDIPATINFIQKQWQTFFPEKVFEYNFLDESLNNVYQTERQLSGIIAYFAAIAVFISCFGLLGVAALTTQQRFKEIGIRKVLGATVGQILQMLSNDFLKLVAIALVIGTPLTYYWVNNWLSNFAFQISFPWWSYMLVGLAMLLLAFTTICGQAFKAARMNPVDSLKEE